MSPTLSIVSPTYNCARQLARHIRGVETQTFRDFEHIIVDNLSTDGTDDLVRAYIGRASHAVQYIREPDGGIYAAMNKGIRRARGEWIHVFNSDNIYTDATVLARVLERDLAEYEILICGTDVGTEGSDRKGPLYQKPEFDPGRGIFRFPHQGMFIRREFYRRHGLYDERFRIISDAIFIFHHCPAAKCRVLDLSVALLPGGGISGRRSLRNTWETVVLLLCHHPAPFGQRLHDAVRQVLQYVRYGLLARIFHTPV